MSLLLAVALAAQVTTLQQMMSAVSEGDGERYASLYAKDAFITIHGGSRLEGRDAIKKYEIDLLHQFPGTQLAFYDVWQDGDRAVVHYAVNSPGTKPTGHEGLLFYRFDASGAILEEHRYLDTLTPMAQMGALGDAPSRPVPVLPSKMQVHSKANKKNVALVVEALKNFRPDAVVDEMMLVTPAANAWRKAAPDATTEITSTLGVDDYVLVEMIVRGTLNGTLGGVTATNKPFLVHRAAIVEVKKGKITSVRAFANGKELAEAVGQWPPSPAR